MARMHALVIISVRPWLEMQGLSLGVEGSGLARWVRARARLQDRCKLGRFYVMVMVAPPIVVGAQSMAFLLRQHVEYPMYMYVLYMCI